MTVKKDRFKTAITKFIIYLLLFSLIHYRFSKVNNQNAENLKMHDYLYLDFDLKKFLLYNEILVELVQ
jgi:hypothetical protein